MLFARAGMLRLWALSSCALLVWACEPSELAPLDGGVDAPRPPPRDAGMPPDDLEGFVDWWMAEGGIYGLAASVVDDGVVVLTLTRGMATETTPVDEHTLFIVASVSKTMTGALLLQLVDEGRLDLDQDVSTYLGYTLRHPSYPDVPITTRMLASHVSGLVDDFIDLGVYSVFGDPTVSLADFARDYTTGPELATHWDREPGTAYSYSNAGFGVLGAIVEAVSGEDLRARSAALVFDPLALDGAGWFLADVDASRLADEFVWNPRQGFMPLEHHGFAFYTASSWRISLTGLTRFVLAHVDGTLDGVTVMSPASLALTRTVAYPTVAGDRAFVWERSNVGGRPFWGHSGSTYGASANVYVRDDGDALVLLTNSDAYVRSRFGDPSGSSAMRAIRDRLASYFTP